MQASRKVSRDEESRRLKGKGEGKLLYSEFMKSILDFQLQEHEKFLSRFTELFKQMDQDGNGIIDEVIFPSFISLRMSSSS